MSIRFSRLAKGMLVLSAMVLMSNCCWAIYHALGPSTDEWGLKYDVQVKPADGDKLNVVFTVADEGRLKPIYSIDLVAFSLQTDSQGGHAYDVKEHLDLKATKDGKRVGQVQIRKEFADRAKIRLLTLTVDGKRHAQASYYDIPLKKYLSPGSAAAPPTATSNPNSPSVATQAKSKVTK
jgi:hypothetical protein